MKLPKFVTICGMQVPVRADPARHDGCYEMDAKVFVIGTANRAEVREILLHEIHEAILYERGHRFACYTEGNAGLRFVMNHHEFENYIKDVAAAMSSVFNLSL